MDCNAGSNYWADSSGTLNASHNLLYSEGKSLTTPADTGNILNQNPRLVDPLANDFHLQADSPAIDVGMTLTGFSNDADGRTRPQGVAWDMGAYEFDTNGETPPPPPSPTPTPPPPPYSQSAYYTQSTDYAQSSYTPPPPPANKFVIGDRVTVTARKLNVRLVPAGKNVGFSSQSWADQPSGPLS